MKIGPETKIFIYGAGARGKIVASSLKEIKNAPKVEGFVDRNAKNICSLDGLPVHPIDEVPIILRQYKEVIFIISVANVFRHIEIAKMLYDAGARYIICKNVDDKSEEIQKINKIYDTLVREITCVSEFPEEIVEFPIHHKNHIEQVSREGAGNTVCLLPVELLFSAGENIWEKNKKNGLIELTPDKRKKEYLMIDRCCLFYWLSSAINRAFGNGVDDDTIQGLNLYAEFRERKKEDVNHFFEEDIAFMKDRCDIFQHMELQLYNDFSFFYNNPVEVEWNEKGYFNLINGNNRAAFLMEKNWNRIPCQMTKEEYEKWYHKEVLLEIKDICFPKEQIYPILHPYYINNISKAGIESINKLKQLCHWMYVKNIEIRGLHILDIACREGYFGQCFTKMGAIVTAVENDRMYNSFCQGMNRLCYTKEIMVYEEIQEVSLYTYDVILIPVWEYERLDCILNLQCKYYIVDIPNKMRSMFYEKYRQHYICSFFNGLFYEGELIWPVVLERK